MRGVNETAIERLLALIRQLKPRHAMLGFKNVGALGRYDTQAEQCNFSLAEMQGLLARAIGRSVEELNQFDNARLTGEFKARLYPIDLQSRPGSGIWVRLTDWRVDTAGLVGHGSTRRGCITPDFRVAPFF